MPGVVDAMTGMRSPLSVARCWDIHRAASIGGALLLEGRMVKGNEYVSSSVRGPLVEDSYVCVLPIDYPSELLSVSSET